MMKFSTFTMGLVLTLLLCSGRVVAGMNGGEARESRLASRLRVYVAGEISVDPSEIEVKQLVPMNGQQSLFPGKIMKVRGVNPGRLLGRVVFVVTMRSGSQQMFKQWVSAEVVQLREVVVTRRKFRRFDVIGADDIRLQAIKIRSQRNQYESDPERVIGKRVTQSLRKGVPIRPNQVEEAPLVRRGDRVTITLQNKGLEIMTTGVAKQDGRLGESIKVVNLDSKKIVFAEVINPGDVRIVLAHKE